ncbi:lipocalin family protein [Flavobacterium sp. MC2016-06]|jgi:hypothetical protein|uniref:lipocalin family protein n=1 Tax=Flavobacterium sp. MC2016-06 TaxID=2676308 RepID=UPI0012BA8610|nr:lipocalin family protein [Flavobacterium sp. MC2016-06]MBU3861687.1 lipocalin family protein [Flavobacterium sp. MC2016-06]
MKTKNILFGLLLSIGLFAGSCSSDDNEGETIIPLAGTYNLSKTGTIVNGAEVLVDAPQNASGCSRDYLELKLSNVAVVGDYDSTVSACALTTTEGTYVRSHNDLTLVVNGVTTTSDIMNLTNKELKIKDKTTGIITVYTR